MCENDKFFNFLFPISTMYNDIRPTYENNNLYVTSSQSFDETSAGRLYWPYRLTRMEFVWAEVVLWKLFWQKNY